jgi:hypothetical protein
MNSDPQHDFPTIRLRPIISYPRRAQAGKSYLMTIDLQLEAPGAPWPFPEEEYAISCILDTQPYFSYEPLEGREPAIVLHRFGGSYGPAQYMLTAAPHELPKGAISITFTNPYGIPIAYTELECEISREAQPGQERAISIRRKGEGEQEQIKDLIEQIDIEYENIRKGLMGMRAGTRPDLIEEQLRQTGWLVQDYDLLDLGAGLGIAVRHYAPRYYDYLLFVDGELAGMVQVRPVGEPLAGSEEAVSPAALRLPTRHGIRTSARSIVPCIYEATGYETRFTNYLEPEPRSRSVFTFHRPETLALWLKLAPPGVPPAQNDLFRSRLRRMPPLSPEGLDPAQYEAIINLERSLAENRPRALIQMPSGRAKTYMAVAAIYRLLHYGGARHVLYLVDTLARVQYVYKQFANYTLPDGSHPFDNQHLIHTASHDTSDVPVYITQMERLVDLLSMSEWNIHYVRRIPTDAFDIIFIDEADLHITGKVRPTLEYFDAFLVGLTEPGNNQMLGFFGRNVVYTWSG